MDADQQRLLDNIGFRKVPFKNHKGLQESIEEAIRADRKQFKRKHGSTGGYAYPVMILVSGNNCGTVTVGKHRIEVRSDPCVGAEECYLLPLHIDIE